MWCLLLQLQSLSLFELKNIADSISILFPWGTLLEYVIKPNRDILSNVADLAKKKLTLNL